jgi:hypothetical protein
VLRLDLLELGPTRCMAIIERALLIDSGLSTSMIASVNRMMAPPYDGQMS